jgi:PAS domain S-box-containing protein
MSEPEPNWAALLDGMASAQVPSGLVIAGPPRAVRSQLIDLVASVERACPGLRTSLWLLGDDGERQVIRERPDAHLAQAWCSTAIRGTAGDLLGALVAFIDQPFEAAPQLQTMLESAAWITGLLIENSRGNNYLWLLERVPSIIYIADSGPYGAWHYASGQIEATLGFTREQWLRDPLLWNQQLHPDDRDDVITLELEAARTGVDPRPAEYRMFHRDGHVVWIRDEARLIKDALGRSRWHGVLSDITEQKRAEAELRLRLAQQAIVARLGEHALERVEISDLLQEAVAAVQEVLGADGAIVAELMPDGESFKFRAVSGGPGIALGAEAAPDGTRAQAIQTVKTGGPVIVSDWDAETRFEHGPAMSEQGIGASLTVSIEGRDQPFGVLGVHASEPREFGRGDVAFVQSLANVLADALERQTTEDAMAHLALHDSLTGLPNRVLFIDRLQHALERLRRPPRSRVAVLFIDLDNFKVVNDTLGHAAGDELLSAVAARLRQAVRPSDTVARFGGSRRCSRGRSRSTPRTTSSRPASGSRWPRGASCPAT